MDQAYIIIDMQNDFISGSLGTPEAATIIPRIEARIIASKKDEVNHTDLFFTQDTHTEDYLDTQEGRKLPIQHCIKDTKGWQICKQLLPYTLSAVILEKPTFGCTDLVLETAPYDRLVLMGLCTDICVISNALLLKAYYPEKEIIVDSSCCAGVTPESHKTALQAMKACHIDVV
ncbi:MAG: cysteine hydrolase [Megasphaera sp.]|jgi:nicotinamidase-related amidase|nr:cysteine hydrolase [Megasphaera sp.]MCH4218356.1 cysteine hydrolase [Megasphaera sp.]